jgi:hypothetical protein
VGHAKTTDFSIESQARPAINKRARSLSPRETDIILSHESNAWAYALNTLAPVLSFDSSDTFYSGDLGKFALETCLGSYEETIEDLYLSSGA